MGGRIVSGVRKLRRGGVAAVAILGFFAGAAGSAAAAPAGTAAAVPAGWSAAKQVDPPHVEPTAISCASPSFCAEVDTDGNALTFSGTSWSAPVRIDNSVLGEGTPIPVNSVSCPSAVFCAAVDDNGNAVTYKSGSWSAPVSIDSTTSLSSVSCPSAAFCAAVDHFGYVITYNGTSWSHPVLVDPGDAGGTRKVSCSSASFCAIVSSGAAVTYNGIHWSAVATTGIGPIIYGISCASPTFCVAEGANGFSGAGAIIYSGGGTWSTPRSSGGGVSVSCPSPVFCAVVSSDGTAATYNSGSWTTPVAIAFGLGSVSCPSATFCDASGVANPVQVGNTEIQDSGAVFTYHGATWSAPTAVDVPGGGPGAVSCPSPTFCAAVSSGMDSSVYRGSAWQFDTYIDSSVAPTSISCPTPAFCMAVNAAGDALTYNGANWSAPGHIDGNGGLSAVSCPSSVFCAAVDISGDVLTYSGGSWSLPEEIDSNGLGLYSVSCPTATFCAALDFAGDALLDRAGTWTAPASAVFEGYGSVSCKSPSFCVAVSEDSSAVYRGSTWGKPATIANPAYTMSAVSCASATFCATVDSGGYAHIYNGSTWSASARTRATGDVDAISCASSSFCVATDNFGNAYTYGGKPPVPVLTSGPTVSGTARVGHTLTCHATYAGATSIAYHWRRNGAAVGAASAAYALTAADYKTHVGCVAQASNASGASGVSASPTVVIALGSALTDRVAPAVTGTAKAGNTVKVKAGSWSPAATSYSYQWLLAGKAIPRATGSSFKIPAADRGKLLSVRVTAHRAGYANGSAVSKALKVSG